MSDFGEIGFKEGESVWVLAEDGSQRAAEYVGQAETSAWFGGPPLCYIVYADTRQGDAVQIDHVIPREP